ncbi:MAG: EAL domain-containing protein [Solirubrobacteraceae bacterium]|nr:EAL domain-containing protein [Solirubrobacteraceae bacterium]
MNIPRDSLLAVIRENVDGMLVIGRDGVVVFANPAAEGLLGRPSETLVGTPFGAPIASGEATEIDVFSAGAARTAEMRVIEIDWQGEPAFLASLRDVTDRKRTEETISRASRQHAAIALFGKDAVSGLAPEALMRHAAEHVSRVLDADFAGVFALEPGEQGLRLVASSCPAIVPLGVAGGAGSQPQYTFDGGGSVAVEDAAAEDRFRASPPEFVSAASVLVSDSAQRFGVLEVASSTRRRFDRDEITFLESFADLLATAVGRYRAEVQIRHQALHDPLTGLGNRTQFLDRLAQGLARSHRQGNGLAVLFLDLDGFKEVNDTLGHHAGDQLLTELAARLVHVLRSSDSVARFGGDEFMMLLEGLGGEEELRAAVDRIQAAVTEEPFVIGGQRQTLTAAIGVVHADETHTIPEELVRDADAAMYHAKERGGGSHAYFDRSMRVNTEARLRMEHELRDALRDGGLRLFYQPIVSLDTGAIVEVEALLRWEHPTRGLLGPVDFLDVAIETGLIIPIGRWTLVEACRQAASWSGTGSATAPIVNVNLSPSELADPGLQEAIATAIDEAGGSVRLQLELTEGALIADPALPATLRDLRARLGVQTSLDDFGTGYSSLAYLTRFTVDELKIDRAFVRSLVRGEDAPIMSAIVSMSHALSIRVVAEGIETEEQEVGARRLGCDRGQGYRFSRPVPGENVAAMLAEESGVRPPQT